MAKFRIELRRRVILTEACVHYIEAESQAEAYDIADNLALDHDVNEVESEEVDSSTKPWMVEDVEALA